MKKYLFKILVFFLLIAGVDYILGTCFDIMLSKSTTTDFGRDNYICNLGNDDLLIFGSSRGLRHYDSVMMTDSLGISCYNCSEEGQGILLNYGRFQMYRQHHVPKVIIYDIEPGFDFFVGDNHRYLRCLKPHCDHPEVMDIISSIDSTERIKVMSKMYQYNTIFASLLIAMRHVGELDEDAGYAPLHGQIKDENKQVRLSASIWEIDSIKVQYMEKFIQSLGDIKLIFVISPLWNKIDRKYFSLAYDLSKKYNIELLDFSEDSKFLKQDKYFKDFNHLNSDGAEALTKEVIAWLKENNICNENK